MRLQRPPSSLNAETRYCARGEFAPLRRQQLARFGVDKRQGEIMQTWVVTDQQHAFRAFGKIPEVFPYRLLHAFIDPSLDDDLWRLSRLGNGAERLPRANGGRANHQVRRDLRLPEIGCYRLSGSPTTLVERPVMVIQVGIIPTRLSVT